MIQPPTNKTIYKGEIADYTYEGGILTAYSKNPKRTIANISENIALVKQITGNKNSTVTHLLIKFSYSRCRNQEIFYRATPKGV